MKTNRLDATTIHAAALLLMLVPFTGCSASLTGETQVSKWDKARDVKAVVTKSNHGATVPFVYHVFLSSTSKSKPYEILLADNLDRINISWEGSDLLLVDIPCGRIFKFQNFYDVLDENGAPLKRVSIVLKNSGLCQNQ